MTRRWESQVTSGVVRDVAAGMVLVAVLVGVVAWLVRRGGHR